LGGERKRPGEEKGETRRMSDEPIRSGTFKKTGTKRERELKARSVPLGNSEAGGGEKKARYLILGTEEGGSSRMKEKGSSGKTWILRRKGPSSTFDE